jgi:hypothetical protein
MRVNKAETAAAMKSLNPAEFSPDFQGNARYHLDGQIYIFSVARREFTVCQEPLFPHLQLRGCMNGERYVLATVIADPVPQASNDIERGGKRVDHHDGWPAAIGICNPECRGADPFMGSMESSVSSGTNLVQQGVFPSRTNPPEESDVRKAEAFRDRRYKWLTDEAFRRAAISTKRLADFLREHEDVRAAMDAQGLQADWHRKSVVTQTCPNCGEDIASGLAFHRGPMGGICILDPERTYRAGVIDKAKYEELAAA